MVCDAGSVGIKTVAVVARITVCYILTMVKEVGNGFVVFPLLEMSYNVHGHNLCYK